MIRIVVSVKPNAFKDVIHLDESGNIIIRIKEAPVDGAANTYLIKFLSREFNIPKSFITLEKGATSHFKKILLAIDQPAFDRIMAKYKK